jgi:membrane protease YdiL (CAAX protease family)
MTEEQPLAGPPLPYPPPAAEPERFPFWGYADLFLLAGLAMPCLFAGSGAVWLAVRILGLHAAPPAAESIAEMSIGYGLLFAAMMVIFRVQYDRPFWRSLGWTQAGVPFLWNVLCGAGTGLLVALIAGLTRTPPTSGPIVEMMQGRTSLILLAIFGTTVAPACEELAFRGFLQPLLVRGLGPVAGIALASALFGALHFQEYGDSWRFALLVAVAGACFGIMRHLTGSTKASAIMHASFNALSFVSLFGQGKHWLQ